ncbi:phenylalanine--tRNA ligase subunit beta [Clostridium cochlearium]|uniref:Phenylalanine--tRNA ligase beta subunit n=2 Tax=Clostridium cochlearium TaxID=1494 RepID=A0A2X2YBP8_CLOCO|nr:phenylalanine--tRNA ligase subunit beta [Clostridium cochlearium]MBU5268282.1 phenylalanine--tRNA ligase subunit beta [Clostridium cochlearium]MCG4571840.1 phenylalanine--tRNA ligase subunit beta [Clostridium cochlearium]NMA57293.1 phenylalanine--tRNA ligase subunit beta [Clostridium cochlearium]SQB35359.1 phenylalanyl-tRNA synthetase subunit beta [Clostridium cochlearium]
MNIPFKWLKDYVDINISANELGDKLTLSGSKVEEIISSGDDIQNVVTGKIERIEKHPDADKLVVCSVNIGKEEPIQIVTGATNMKEEDIVPVAVHGAILPNDVKIKKGKLRGIMSYGMMCSEKELGIPESGVDGLMILPPDTPIGKDIKEVLNLDNAVIEFEITSNRPDCLSVVGIAREAAATLGINYTMPKLDYTPKNKDNIKDYLEVEIKDDLCRRYMSRGVKNVKIQPSPTWMQERLEEAGVRAINNIVDITNFVMIELGQPLHAFDGRQITSNKIVVERAKAGEKFTTLDDVERTIDESVLCIKDGDRTVALAGIMGGLNSEVKEDTKEIILECANFDGTNIRVSSQKLGLRTEASSKFEKDLDPNLVQIAMNRVCHLIEELGAGEVMEGTIDIYKDIVKERNLKVDYNWINSFLGTNISKEDMKEYLDRLELKTNIEGDILNITVPTFRSDIVLKQDVAEEIARIYGYNNIPTTMFNSVSVRSGKTLKQHLQDKVVEILIGSGLNQSISYSFVSPKIFDKILIPEDSNLRNAVKIKNPLGEDYSLMRTTTLASMMEALARNYSRNNSYARLFEMGKVYIPSEDEKILPEERNTLVIGMYGDVDYLSLKGVIENLVEELNIEKSSYKRESEHPTFHPGKTAKLYVNKEFAGLLGEVHPDVLDNYDIDEKCYIAELNLDILLKNANIEKKYSPLPKFPAVERDMALLVDDEVLVQDIENIIRNKGGKILENVKLFDVYKGSQIPKGKKSVAYSIVYRMPNRTLTDSEVSKVHNKIVRTLENNLGAELR